MKKLKNLKNVKTLNREQQKNINGQRKGPTCGELWVSANCCDPFWTSCGFTGAEYCINGQCIL